MSIVASTCLPGSAVKACHPPRPQREPVCRLSRPCAIKARPLAAGQRGNACGEGRRQLAFTTWAWFM